MLVCIPAPRFLTSSQAYCKCLACPTWTHLGNKTKWATLSLRRCCLSRPPHIQMFETNSLWIRPLLLFLIYMDFQSSHDTAIYACIVVTFYSISCFNEFTVPFFSKFFPHTHIIPLHILHLRDTNNLEVVAFHLLRTKCAPTEENTQCAPISHLMDPLTWLNSHFCNNTPGPKDHLFLGNTQIAYAPSQNQR